eukprot:g11486.t1
MRSECRQFLEELVERLRIGSDLRPDFGVEHKDRAAVEEKVDNYKTKHGNTLCGLLRDRGFLSSLIVEVSLVSPYLSAGAPSQYYLLWYVMPIRIDRAGGAIENNPNWSPAAASIVWHEGTFQFELVLAGLCGKTKLQKLRAEITKTVESSLTVQEMRLSLLRRQGLPEDETQGATVGGHRHFPGAASAAAPSTCTTGTDARTKGIEPTDEQKRVVHADGPLLLHGHTGTAKTTLLQFRALEHERKDKGLALFTSANPFLLRSIEKNYVRLGGRALSKNSRMGRPIASMCELLQMPENKHSGTLFLTFEEFARLLDKSIPVGGCFYDDSACSWCHVAERLAKTLHLGKERQRVGRGREVAFPWFLRDFWTAKREALASNMTAEEAYVVILAQKVKHMSEALGALYALYDKWLREDVGGWDAVDACASLTLRSAAYQHLTGGLHKIYEGAPRFSAVLSDESQDLLVSQLGLLRLVCDEKSDPHGFTLAVDPLQSIAEGRTGHPAIVDFTEVIAELCAEASATATCGAVPFRPAVAASARGASPRFVSGVPDVAFWNLIAGVEKSSLGADQVVLVRSEDAKQKIAQLLPPPTILLTVSECKGLEFADVIVVDFFANPSNPTERRKQQRAWMSLLRFLPGAEGSSDFATAMDHPDAVAAALPPADSWLLDLRLLYVASARARRRLVFFQGAPPAVEGGTDTQTQNYYEAPGFTAALRYVDAVSAAKVKNSRHPLAVSIRDEQTAARDVILTEFAQSSSPSEYVARGADFLEKGEHELAARMFSAAGAPSLAAFASAHAAAAASAASQGEKADSEALRAAQLAASLCTESHAESLKEYASLAELQQLALRWACSCSDMVAGLESAYEAAGLPGFGQFLRHHTASRRPAVEESSAIRVLQFVLEKFELACTNSQDPDNASALRPSWRADFAVAVELFLRSLPRRHLNSPDQCLRAIVVRVFLLLTEKDESRAQAFMRQWFSPMECDPDKLRVQVDEVKASLSIGTDSADHADGTDVDSIKEAVRGILFEKGEAVAPSELRRLLVARGIEVGLSGIALKHLGKRVQKEIEQMESKWAKRLDSERTAMLFGANVLRARSKVAEEEEVEDHDDADVDDDQDEDDEGADEDDVEAWEAG